MIIKIQVQPVKKPIKIQSRETTVVNVGVPVTSNGGVTSVFGRTGAVTAVSGDYDASQIDETTNEKIFTSAERSKLSGIENGATADQTDGEIESAYNSQVPAATKDEAEAGTESSIRRFSPLRIYQAIKAILPKAHSSTHTDGTDDIQNANGTQKGLLTNTEQTIGGVKTFTSFSITPSSAPSTDYQVANKKYVDDNAGGGGGYNETFIPLFSYPDSYGNLSGLTGRWTASGSGTNEYYYTFDTPQPVNVLYNGSNATQGTAGSLANQQWDYADNDTLGYTTIYVRDDSGDPDSLAVNSWMADWWGVDGVTPAFADEEDFGYPVHFDSSTDQGVICKLKAIPADVATWTLKVFARSADRSTTGTITVRALDRAIKDNGADLVSATTLATSTFSLTADGSIITISGTIANLDATTGQIPEIAIIRDVSEDAVATSVAFDLDTLEVQYAPA